MAAREEQRGGGEGRVTWTEGGERAVCPGLSRKLPVPRQVCLQVRELGAFEGHLVPIGGGAFGGRRRVRDSGRDAQWADSQLRGDRDRLHGWGAPLGATGTSLRAVGRLVAAAAGRVTRRGQPLAARRGTPRARTPGFLAARREGEAPGGAGLRGEEPPRFPPAVSPGVGSRRG